MCVDSPVTASIIDLTLQKLIVSNLQSVCSVRNPYNKRQRRAAASRRFDKMNQARDGKGAGERCDQVDDEAELV